MTAILCPHCGPQISSARASDSGLCPCPACGKWVDAPPDDGRRKVTVTVVAGPDAGKSCTFEAELVIGRGRDAGLQLADPDVSRHHARLTFDNASCLVLEDLHSSNGTFLGPEKVTRSTLPNGAEVRLGTTTRVRFAIPDGGPMQPAADAVPILPALDPDQVRATCYVEPSGGGLELLDAVGSRLEPLSRSRASLQLVCRASEVLSSLLEPATLVERLLELVFETVPADRACVLLFDLADKRIETRVERSRTGEPGAKVTLSTTVLRRVLNERVGLLTEDALVDEGIASGKSILAEGIRSVLCTPIVCRERLFGAIYLDTVKRVAAFDESDLEALMALSRQAGIGLDNARLAERIRAEAVARTNLQRYLPGHLVDKVFRKEINLEPGGTRTLVTVLFTDLRGFTQKSAGMEPERVIELVNAYFEEMIDVVFKFGGTLDKFIGDALMAEWGAFVPCPDGAVRAIGCALEMQARLEAFNRAHVADGWPVLEMGVGINTGPAIAGNLGAQRRMEYTVLGHTVNLASRLESLNKELHTRILIGKETCRQAEGRFLVTPHQTHVKGIEQPVQVFSVEGVVKQR